MRLLGLTLLVLAVIGPSAGAATVDERKLSLYGDLRLRLESDWDSRQADGTEREDRRRVRMRARLGLEYAPNEHVLVGARLRSGSDASQQSPHITILDFDGNDTGDAEFNLDRWFLEARRSGFWGWAGRNSAPFWKQNELFWDDDATPLGLAAGYRAGLRGPGKLSLNAAYLSLPVGMRRFSGNLGLAQVVYETRAGEMEYTLAGAFFVFDADQDDPDAADLLQGNGSREYCIWVGSGQIRIPLGGRPLILGADYMHNIEDYSASDPDPFTAANRDETDGYALHAGYGGTGRKGEWLAGYSYARIETFAVNNSYGQDDWVRWGTATQNRPSDMRGHEIRFAYALADRLNVVARLYLVEAITTVEDGRRFRIDLDYGF